MANSATVYINLDTVTRIEKLVNTILRCVKTPYETEYTFWVKDHSKRWHEFIETMRSEMVEWIMEGPTLSNNSHPGSNATLTGAVTFNHNGSVKTVVFSICRIAEDDKSVAKPIID